MPLQYDDSGIVHYRTTVFVIYYMDFTLFYILIGLQHKNSPHNGLKVNR